jgi:hypothetical protein
MITLLLLLSFHNDLLPNCVENVKVNPAEFHCEVSKDLKHLTCDTGAFEITLRPGSTVEKCTVVHVDRGDNGKDKKKDK